MTLWVAPKLFCLHAEISKFCRCKCTPRGAFFLLFDRVMKKLRNIKNSSGEKPVVKALERILVNCHIKGKSISIRAFRRG